MGKLCRLTEMEKGATAVIRSLPDGLPSLARLREMGLLPGTRLTFVRRAPLGDPLEFMVRGALLSLRGTEAVHIEVEVVP